MGGGPGPTAHSGIRYWSSILPVMVLLGLAKHSSEASDEVQSHCPNVGFLESNTLCLYMAI